MTSSRKDGVMLLNLRGLGRMNSVRFSQDPNEIYVKNNRVT
jgi:hypothetical protein